MSYTKRIDKQSTNIKYAGTWTNLGGGVLSGTGIEDAQNVSLAYGTFGNALGNGTPFASEIGGDAVVVKDGTHFQYNKRMDASLNPLDPKYDATDGFGTTIGGIFDTGITGSLDTGKVCRLVQDGLNIVNPGGLNLKVYAKSLTYSANSLESPSKDEIYIDPLRGKFLLPRPIYFSTIDSGAAFTTPILKYKNYTPSYTIAPSAAISNFSNTGKFGKCYYIRKNTNGAADSIFYPFSASPPTLSSGTCSLWFSLATGGSGGAGIIVYLGSSTYVIIYRYHTNIPYVQVVVNGSSVSYVTLPAWTEYVFYHMYICWDTAAGMTGAKTIRVYINGTERGSSTTSFVGNAFTITARATGNYFGSSGETELDHVKVWNHVVNESPAWDYNSGSGVQNGLHEIYPASSDRIPILDSSSSPASGVGYLYITTSDDTASITTGSSNKSITLEDAYDINHCTGYFGTGGGLAKSSHVKLIVDTDYEFDKRLDASNIEDATDGFGIVTGGIWDTSDIDAAMSAGKYIRIIQNGKNLKTSVVSGGLGLKVFAKNLGKFTAPPSDRCYVDPATGKFALPGPSFWSKMNDDTAITTPEIYDTLPSVLTNGSSTNKTFLTGKFGNCLAFGNANVQRYYKLSPFGTYAVEDLGTLSMWQRFGNGCTCTINFSGNNNYVQINLTTISLYISGVLVQTVSTGIASSSVFSHIYMIWDKDTTIEDGKYLKVFINGSEKVSSEATWVSDYFSIRFIAEQTTEYLYTDALKIWNHVVDTDPSWDYNSGTGYENSLHSIYGSLLEYRPEFTSTTLSGVGYYRKSYDIDHLTITV